MYSIHLARRPNRGFARAIAEHYAERERRFGIG
jgi:hypothetical protein